MKAKVITIDAAAAGEIELNPSVFGLPARKDILQRMVEWQRARARSGTHKTKQRAEVSGTTKKMYKQKGTGNARHGAKRAPQFVGGGVVFGPLVRTHAYELTKKFRRLALKTALSVKHASGDLVILSEATLAEPKTSLLVAHFAKLGWQKPLIVDATLDEAFAKAARNIKHVDVLPQVGVNVYDILRHKELVLTKAAVETLEARLS
jgi:large subunit ribosomal protein L4